MIQVLAAAGRALMGAGRTAAAGGRAAGEKAATAGPRGANEAVEHGAKGAGKSSPMDMLGNVANIASVGMMGFDMFGGGGDKKAEGAGGKPKSHYESVLDN